VAQPPLVIPWALCHYIRVKGDSTPHPKFFFFSLMSNQKAAIINAVKETCEENNVSYDRIVKFQMFCNVCDNLLSQNLITKAQHKRWTEIF